MNIAQVATRKALGHKPLDELDQSQTVSEGPSWPELRESVSILRRNHWKSINF